MYVCICVCECTHVCVCVSVYVSVHVCVCVCEHACVCVCVCVNFEICMSTWFCRLKFGRFTPSTFTLCCEVLVLAAETGTEHRNVIE